MHCLQESLPGMRNKNFRVNFSFNPHKPYGIRFVCFIWASSLSRVPWSGYNHPQLFGLQEVCHLGSDDYIAEGGLISKLNILRLEPSIIPLLPEWFSAKPLKVFRTPDPISLTSSSSSCGSAPSSPLAIGKCLQCCAKLHYISDPSHYHSTA